MHRLTVEGVVKGRHITACNHEGYASVVKSDEEVTVALAVVLEKMEQRGEAKAHDCSCYVKEEGPPGDEIFDLIRILHDGS